MRPAISAEAEVTLEAYGAGLFPMAERRDSEEWAWVEPEVRAVIPLDGLRISRRLRRRIRSRPFGISVDTDFAGVIGGCAEPAPGREGTWISGPIRRVFLELHSLGLAHSVECWRGGALAGGLYGLALKGAFFGESMFSRERDASKVALAHLVERLRAGGFALLDAQFVTPHLTALGARPVPREDFLGLLDAALGTEADFFRAGPAGPLAEGAYPSPPGGAPGRQSTTQTSSVGCSRADRLGLEANIQPRKICTSDPEP